MPLPPEALYCNAANNAIESLDFIKENKMKMKRKRNESGIKGVGQKYRKISF